MSLESAVTCIKKLFEEGENLISHETLAGTEYKHEPVFRAASKAQIAKRPEPPKPQSKFKHGDHVQTVGFPKGHDGIVTGIYGQGEYFFYTVQLSRIPFRKLTDTPEAYLRLVESGEVFKAASKEQIGNRLNPRIMVGDRVRYMGSGYLHGEIGTIQDSYEWNYDQYVDIKFNCNPQVQSGIDASKLVKVGKRANESEEVFKAASPEQIMDSL